MKPLNRKLARDLWRLRGQVVAVAMVIASGVAVLSMSLSTIEALGETATAYYERYRFAHVFANVRRAPEYLAERARLFPGVQSISTRVMELAVLDIEGFAEPVIGQLVSIPDRGEPALNRLALQTGRFPRPGRPDEAVVSEPFAAAHSLTQGSSFRAILNGHWRELTVVGVALSPEFVYTIGPGALMPDNQRFGIVWMSHEALQAAFDLDGAFNEISLGLLRGTDPDDVIRRLDISAGDYGGVGAYARKDQISNWFLMNEIKQLETMSTILPVLFLIIATFLTNMVLTRLITVERSEIGLLKAFGYRGRDIGWHYIKLTIAIAGVGIVIGCIAGYWFGLSVTRVYAAFYKFPFLLYQPSINSFALASGVSMGAALARHARHRAQRCESAARRGHATAGATDVQAQRIGPDATVSCARPAVTNPDATDCALAAAVVRYFSRCRHGGRRSDYLHPVARLGRAHGRCLLQTGPAQRRHGGLLRCARGVSSAFARRLAGRHHDGRYAFGRDADVFW